MAQTPRSWLLAQGLILPHDLPSASGEFRLECPKCQHHNQKFYVNALAKGVNCKHCGYKASWRAYQRLYEPPSPQEQALESFVSKSQESLGQYREYLHERGFTDATIDQLRFGFADPERLGTPTDVDVQIGLADESGWYFRDRIIIPYIQDGIVQQVRGRVTPESTSPIKYLGVRGGESQPYRPAPIEPSKPVVICEGELDAALLMQHGYQAIGIPGANNFQKTWVHDYSNLYLAFDNDKAGRDGTKTILTKLEEVRCIELPDTLDVSDYIETFGIESFAQLVDRATLHIFGKAQRDDRLKVTVEDWSEWAFTNGELLGPRIRWAPRLERALSGWSRGVYLLGALPNSGKSCTAKGTPILYYDGTVRPCEDVRIGDVLMGPDSKPRTVQAVCSGVAQLHRVTYTKSGEFYLVTGNHTLSLKHREVNNYEPFNMTVEEYYGNPRFHERMMGYRASVEFPEKPVLLDPYFLGLWLGDGTSCRQDITNCDFEVTGFMKSYATQLGMTVREDGKRGKATAMSITHGVRGKRNPIRDALRAYSLLDNKHIPQEFKANSREVRSQLLAGLIDSDGHYDALAGHYEISQKSQRLAEDIMYLCRSLGLKCTSSRSLKTCTNNGVSGHYTRLYISGDLSQIPIRVHRKRYLKTENKRICDVKRAHIEVKPDEIGEFYGFQVDGDNLFMLGDFTVTHNCFLVQSAYECAKDNPHDTISVYLSLDDDIEDAITRLVSNATQIDFEAVRAPRTYLDSPTDVKRRDEQAFHIWNNTLEELKRYENLIIRDAKYGRSLGYLQSYFRSLRNRYPSKHIVIFIDSLAKIIPGDSNDTKVDSTNKSAWKAFLASELKYQSTLHNLCIVTPCDFRKINDNRRPTNDDLKDAAELSYEANVILLGFNELNANAPGSDAVLTWEHEGNQYPLFEVNISKNKKTKFRGNIRFQFYPNTCAFKEQTQEQDEIVDELIRMKAEEKKERKAYA